MTESDDHILALLAQDGRIPTRTIAEAIGVSEPTAAARVRALEASGAVRIVLKQKALHDLPSGALFKAELFLEDRTALDAVAQGLMSRPGIIAAYKTASLPEIIVTCVVPHIREAGAYFEELAGALPGLARVDTAMIFSARHQRPWLHNLGMPERVALDDPDPLRAALRRDARQPASAIARALGIPEATARQRTRRLLDAPGHRVVAMRDATANGYSIWADIQLTVAPAHVATTFARMEAVEDIVMIAHVSGERNISLFVAAASVDSLDHFVSRDVRSLPGLRSFRMLRVTDVITTDYSVDF